MRPCFPLISLLLLWVMGTTPVHGQQMSQPLQPAFVDSVGSHVRYSAMIELPKAYLSGICVMKVDADGVLRGCLFNEFGISALEFTYAPGAKKMKLQNVIKMMNKWYIKRVLSRDLLLLYRNLQRGIPDYQNKKYHITYRFSLLEEDKQAYATEE